MKTKARVLTYENGETTVHEVEITERQRSKMDHGIHCEDQNSKTIKGQFTSLTKQTQRLAMISARNCCRSFL